MPCWQGKYEPVTVEGAHRLRTALRKKAQPPGKPVCTGLCAHTGQRVYRPVRTHRAARVCPGDGLRSTVFRRVVLRRIVIRSEVFRCVVLRCKAENRCERLFLASRYLVKTTDSVNPGSAWRPIPHLLPLGRVKKIVTSRLLPHTTKNLLRRSKKHLTQLRAGVESNLCTATRPADSGPVSRAPQPQGCGFTQQDAFPKLSFSSPRKMRVSSHHFFPLSMQRK